MRREEANFPAFSTVEFSPRELLVLRELVADGVTINEYRIEVDGRIAVELAADLHAAVMMRVRARRNRCEQIERMVRTTNARVLQRMHSAALMSAVVRAYKDARRTSPPPLSRSSPETS